MKLLLEGEPSAEALVGHPARSEVGERIVRVRAGLDGVDDELGGGVLHDGGNDVRRRLRAIHQLLGGGQFRGALDLALVHGLHNRRHPAPVDDFPIQVQDVLGIGGPSGLGERVGPLLLVDAELGVIPLALLDEGVRERLSWVGRKGRNGACGHISQRRRVCCILLGLALRHRPPAPSIQGVDGLHLRRRAVGGLGIGVVGAGDVPVQQGQHLRASLTPSQ